ncbi:MAG TPA: enoyl-CoA hydratase-related protein [Burkholderiales bacterium]|nr:enoyl-CoA hydratase-related protein [Burkholderiales bacterium]
MNTPGILIERDHNVGWIRINRPDRLNSFSGTMREDLERALQQMEEDPEVRCVIVTGVGRAFSTGGDVSFMKQLIDVSDIATFEHLVRAGAKIVQRIADMSKPVIAAVNGPAAGAGACLALACDLRVASESATIGFGFLRVGLHPDWGGSYFLPRLIGIARAAEFVLTGEMINAERGERLGIFNRVVAAPELEANARVLAGQMAAAPQRIVADWKRTLRASLHQELPAVLEMETEAQLRAFRSPDFREGIESFLEKRAPRFGKK